MVVNGSSGSAAPGGPNEANSDQHLDARATRSASWALLGFGGAQTLRFAGNLVLTRLIAPDAFGVMVIISATLMGLVLFSDIGLGPSIVQNKRGDEPAFQNTAWTIQLGRGLLLFAVCCAAAFPMAHLYEKPDLAWLIPAAGLSTLFSGATSIKLLSTSRNLQLREYTLVEIMSQVVSLVVTITWAWLSPSVASLVAGTVAGAAARVVFCWVFLDGPHGKLQWDKDAARQILALGKWIFLNTALMFLAGQLDRFIFGLLFDFTLLGVYNLAIQLSIIPSTALGHLATSVVFPYLSRLFALGGDVRHAYQSARRPMLLLGGWAMSGLLAGGPTLVAFLYPESFSAAGVMLQIVIAGVWFGVVLEGPNGAALLAQGKARWTAAGSTAKIIGMALFMPAGLVLGERVLSHPLASFLGALAGLAAAEALRYAVSLYAVVSLGLARPAQDVRLTLGVLASGALGLGAGHATHLVDVAGAAASLGLGVAASARVASLLEGIVIAIVVSLSWAPSLWPIVKSRKLFQTPAP